MFFSCYTYRCFKKSTYAISKLISQNNGKLINVAVLLFRFDDPYMSSVKQSLEKIENENKDKVKFNFFDGNNNQVEQSQTINTLFSNNYNLLLINLVDSKASLMDNIVNRVKQNNIPIILFNFSPPTTSSTICNYNRVVIIGTDDKQAGIFQGKIISDIWNTNKKSIDKNGDNILEYVMLQGKINNTAAINRTKYSISAIRDAGIQTKELALRISDWNEDLAKSNIEALFSRYGDNIEAIIANNDAMAIGAIKALQKQGYNKGDKSKNVVVVGIDGIPETKELIDKGIMSGTVIQNPDELATALYTIGMNLVYERPALTGTNYKFDQTGVTIETPFYEYKKSQ